MRAAICLLLTVWLINQAARAECSTLLDFEYRPLSERTQKARLCEQFADQVVLVVNTASKCGYTPQYEGLEALHARYRDQGFAVAGFPSNDFGAQEPGSEQEIREFCTLTYGVKFPMFEKSRVIGDQADPFFVKLAEVSGGAPQWNFHKYLIGKDGQFIASFPSKVTPEDPALVSAIEAALQADR
ncbi:MAG: glutathione peroxidase [Xanthomonadales bacterium]|nr:glutathione peroxidase [Xanthomonadales bacterium]